MNKIEVFACTGCGIGEVIDMEELEEIPDEEGYTFTTHPCLCNNEGIDLLKKTIDEKSCNTF